MDPTRELAVCAESIGKPPRRFPLWLRLSYLRIGAPEWVRLKHDDLERHFASTKLLLERGRLTWGCTVQANALLFQPGKHDCPGEVLYGTDPRASPSLEELGRIATELFDLKGTFQPDPAFANISEYLANERIRVFGLNVPSLVSGKTACAVSTVFFVRKHLPNGVLSYRWYPLLVLDAEPRTAMVLPSRYWSDALVTLWHSET